MTQAPQHSPHQKTEARNTPGQGGRQTPCLRRISNIQWLGESQKVRTNFAKAIPLLAPQQGGVAERAKEISRSIRFREAGVVFRLKRKWKTIPLASISVATRHFFDGAA